MAGEPKLLEGRRARGYYHLPRGWMEHEIFEHDKNRIPAFLLLVENAKYSSTSTKNGGRVKRVEIGQQYVSYRQLENDWKDLGFTLGKVRGFMNDLKNYGLATIESDIHGTKLTLCDYPYYKSNPQRGNTDV